MTEYHAFEVVIKIPLYSDYERRVIGQDYDVFLKMEDKIFLYKGIKPSRLSSLLETIVLNPAKEIDTMPE